MIQYPVSRDPMMLLMKFVAEYCESSTRKFSKLLVKNHNRTDSKASYSRKKEGLKL